MEGCHKQSPAPVKASEKNTRGDCITGKTLAPGELSAAERGSTLRNSVPKPSVGTFNYLGLETDNVLAGAFSGAIEEHDSVHGFSGGQLTEVYAATGEGGAAGIGKITTHSDSKPIDGLFVFAGVKVSGGPLYGSQAGIVVGAGWVGVYVEGHKGFFAQGQGCYFNWGGF